jgi:hypothetical protein
LLSASRQRVSRGPSNGVSNASFRAFFESRLEGLSHGFLQAPNSRCKRIAAVLGQLSNKRLLPRDKAFRGNCRPLNNFQRTRNNAPGDALRRSKERGNPMARSARKPDAKRTNLQNRLQRSRQNDRDARRGRGGKTAAKAASGASLKPDIEFAGFQSGQFESLRAVLEKRSDASGSDVPLPRSLPRSGFRFTRSISSFWFQH